MTDVPKIFGAAATLPVSHAAAREAVERIIHRDAGTQNNEDDIRLLARYFVEREQASRDMKAALDAVINLYGPPALAEVRKFVENERAKNTVLSTRKSRH